MCGIVATVGVDPVLIAELGPDALTAIAHRGPDDEGSWSDGVAWLGHRRLAIIDLTQGGHQPMIDERSGVALTFGGEIYNYIELRAELEGHGHVFRTKCDTEVLLAAYLEWGESCLNRFNGMWSFVIWDPRTRRAFFARDRFGVKPLYYAMAGGGLAIASEPKALLAIDPQLRRVDEAALYAFLAEGQLYSGDRSFYAGIHVLQPAHYGTFGEGAGSPDIRRYWAPPDAARSALSYDEAVRTFSDLLDDSVALRLRSDVPVGFTLSGGLDSSAILQSAVAATSSRGGTLQAFTSVYTSSAGARDVGERRWAAEVAAKYERVDFQPVDAKHGDWLGVLGRVVWHMDGPGNSPAVFPLWRIMERARAARIPVLLEGQGADELLAGYPQYAALALWEQIRANRLASLRHDFRSYARTFSIRQLTLWLARERMAFVIGAYRRRVGALGTLDPDFVEAFKSTPRAPVPRSVNARLSADLTRDILPGLLQYGDAISMAHSIESRLPFLDYRLVEFASSLPSEFKVGAGETKRVLRDHLRTVDLSVIANRRRKHGYPTPANTWMAEDGGAALKDLLLSPNAEIRSFCRPKRIERLIEHHASGRGGAGNHLYRILTTELWLRTCIKGEHL